MTRPLNPPHMTFGVIFHALQRVFLPGKIGWGLSNWFLLMHLILDNQADIVRAIACTI